MQVHALIPFIACSVLCSLNSLALAQPTASKKSNALTSPTSELQAHEQAAQFMKEGQRLFKQNRFDDAVDALTQAFALMRTYDIAVALGDAEAKLGWPTFAASHLRYALNHFPINASRAERDAIQKRFEKARAQVGALTLRVNIAGANLFLNGVAVGTSPIDTEVFVDPGELSVEAKLADHEPQRKSLFVLAGGAETVEMNLVKLKPKVEPEETKMPIEPPKRNMIPAYVMGAGALLSFGFAIGFEAAGNNKADRTAELVRLIGDAKAQGEPQAKCDGPSPTHPLCSEYAKARADALRYANTSLGLSIAGALLGAGAFLYWLWPEEPKARLSIAPALSATFLGSSIGGAF